MTATAIRIIKDEHLAIASVLYSLRALLRQIGDHGATPDFNLLRAILDYIVVFPERLHHPKESLYLFRRLGKRCRDAARLIAELEAEHILGARLIAELRAALDAYAQAPERGFAAFSAAVETYAQFHWTHMLKEEEELLPLAEAHLDADDWDAVLAAFRENDNPLFGIKPREQTETLYQKILSLTPPRAGLDPERRRSG